MKLLSKNEIVQQKNLERKAEIDEGAKLARKIDALREAASIEETRIAKFRDETLGVVKHDIETLVSTKVGLESDVRELDEKRRALQIPYDFEWGKIEDEKRSLKEREEEYGQLYTNLLKQTLDMEDEREKFELEKVKIHNVGEASAKALVESQNNRDESKRIILSAQEKRDEIQRQLDEQNRLYLNREAIIAVKEREVSIAKKQLEVDRLDIDKIRIQLQDQRATLERAMQRLKK